MRPGTLLWPAGVFVLALAARTVPFVEAVFRPNLLYPYGDGDVLYHLRRIRALVEAWPALADHDAWMAHPDGAYAIWSPLFDYLPATAALLTGGPPDAIALVWPALLGAATAVVLYLLVRRLHGPGAAIVAAALFSLLPGGVLVGALGRVDHHVAEVFLQVAVNALVLRHLDHVERAEALPRLAPLWLGLWMGASLLTWAGSLLFLVVPASALALGALIDPDARRARVIAGLSARAFAIAALVALPYGALNVVRGREPFAPHFLSLLQPVACLLLAAGGQLAIAVRGRGAAGPRAALLSAGGLLALLGAVLWLPGVGPGLRSGLAFVTRQQSPWLAEIAEFQPVLASDATLRMMTGSLGYALFALPPTCVLAAYLWLTGKRSHVRLLLIVWGVHATALAFFQLRFLAYATPIAALAPGWLFFMLAARGRGAALLSAALALAALVPAARYWSPLITPGPTAFAYPQMRPQVHRFLDAVGRVTPPAGDAGDLARAGRYCVFAPWDLGHGLLWYARRPVVANGFGSHLEGGGYDDSLAVYRAARVERDVLAVLDRRGCRYLVTEAHVPGAALGPFARQLHEHDGSDATDVRGAGSLQLVLEAADLPIHGHAGYKLFARVVGARVQAPAGDTPIVLRTTVPSRARTLEYRRALPASIAPREIRLAYPGAYEVLIGGHLLGTLRIAASAVARGDIVTIPIP